MTTGPKISGNPYVGPRTFLREQGRLFFGREREARDLSARVMSERLLLFYAQSGAGKSSLINTRLIPNLLKNRYAVLPVARVSGDLPPTVNQVDNIFLFNLMTSLLDKQVGDPNRFASLTLKEFLAGLSSEDGKVFIYEPSIHEEPSAQETGTPTPYVLILDQFEEIVTGHPGRWKEREEFFRQLNEALLDDPNLWVLMTLREDYVAALDPYKPMMFNRLHATFFMQRMEEAAAMDAVRKPAELGGRPFAPGVAEKLVEDLLQVRVPGQTGTIKGQYVEPVQLQVVCYQLWQTLAATAPVWQASEMGRKQATITFDDLKVAGDVNQALERFYDDTVNDAAEALKTTPHAADTGIRQLRSWFEDELITKVGTRNLIRQSDEMTGSLPNAAVRELQRRFLVRTETRSGDAWVELIHDRFIEPIRASNQRWREQRRREQPWIDAAYGWHESGDSPETRNAGLLLADLNLKTVLADTAGQQFEPVIVEYLEASKEAQDKRDQAAALDALRLQATAESERADLEARTAKRLRRRGFALGALTGVVFALLLLVGILALTVKLANDDLTEQNQLVEEQKSQLEDQKSLLEDQNRQLGAKNITLEISRTQLTNERNRASAALDENRSLTLADQARNTSVQEDSLLLARAAMLVSDTLAADGALLEGLDQAYRNENNEIMSYIPHDILDMFGTAYLHSLAFSGDGRVLAAGDEGGGIILWDNIAGQPIGERLNAGASARVTGLAMDAAGSRLVSATGNPYDPNLRSHKLILWNLDDPAAPQPTIIAANQPSILSVALSSDGRLLAVAYDTQPMAMWDLAGATPARLELAGMDTWNAQTVALDAAGERLVAGGSDGRIILWDNPGSSQPLSQTLALESDAVRRVELSPDGNTLATGGADGALKLWDLTDEARESRLLDNRSQESLQARSMAFRPDDGQLAASWSNDWGDGSLRLYNIEQPASSPLEISQSPGAPLNLRFDPASPDHLLAVNSYDPNLSIWNLAGGSEFATIQPLPKIDDIAVQSFSPDGSWLAEAGKDRRIYLTKAGESDLPVVFTANTDVSALAVSSSGEQLAVAGCSPAANSDQSEPTPTPPPKDGINTGSEPSQNAGVASAAGAADAGCRIEIWSVFPGQPATSAMTLPVPSRVTALAFHPLNEDLLAVGGRSGEVQVMAMPSGEPVMVLDDKVPGLADLSFSADGDSLAALGEGGLVNAWTWRDGKSIHESEVNEGQATSAQTRFTQIAFVGDWLAVVSDEPPRIGLWTIRRAEPVASPIELTSGTAGDLAYDQGQQVMTVAQPDRTMQLPMSRERWLVLACDRAGRNLNYADWLRAFPDEDNYKSARICDYDLDVSFARQLVTEADKAIDDCTPEQWNRGMGLLRTAMNLPVEPPLSLDPLQEAIRVVSDRALEHLQQQAPSYDDQARTCLQLASDQLASIGNDFDVELAMEAGRKQVALDARLAAAVPPDTVSLMSDIAWIEDHRDQWPGELPVRVLAPDQEASGRLAAGQEPAYFFFGKAGQEADVLLTGTKDYIDAYLRLQAPNGTTLGETYGYGERFVAQLENVVLPIDGLYRIVPGAYNGNGDYELALDIKDLPVLPYGTATAVLPEGGNIWLFTGESGQVTSVEMDLASPTPGAHLTMEKLDSSWTWSAYGSESSPSVRVAPVPLPTDGQYLVRVDLSGATIPYTLTVRETEPLPLVLGAARESTLADGGISIFAGQPGQIISASLTTTDTSSLPSLEILSARGDLLGSATADSETGLTTVSGLILAGEGPFYARVDGLASQSPYRLRIDEIRPAVLRIDETVRSTTGGGAFWTLDGQPGEAVRIDLKAAEGSDLDTLVRLFSPDGRQIESNDDYGADYDSLLALVLPDIPGILIQADRYGGSGEFTLSATELPTESLPLDGTTVDLVSDRAWTMAGEAGQVLTLDIADNGDGSYGGVRLFTADGHRIGSSDGNASLSALLPQNGTYIVVPWFDIDYQSGDQFKATLTDAADATDLDALASQMLTTLATGDALDLALSLYRWGTTEGAVQFSAEARMALCWHGALNGVAGEVIGVCEALPGPSETTDPAALALQRDVRGLARALTGDIEGAISDFEEFAENGNDPYQRAQRAEWVFRLRAGDPVSAIFDEATVKELLAQ